MSKKSEILFKKIAHKTIVWFENSNQYTVLENATAKILEDLTKSSPIKKIAKKLSKELSIPEDKAFDFILDIEKELYITSFDKKENIVNDYRDFKKPDSYQFSKKYLINDIVLKVDFQSEEELFLVHPKFAHLETENTLKENFHYQVFTQNNFTFLLVDKKLIGSWSQKEIHFFQGKFSMQIVQNIHQKEEEKWLGVFHASAVSDDKSSMLFLGDSGNGKSTSLALLQANGFTCLADDFVPVDAAKQEVYSFPSAISIKKNSLKTLLPLYPELENSAEFHFKRLHQIVRYLPPNNTNYKKHLPCKALIFIKYESESDLVLNKISKLNAFEKLVPDSWLSPIKENASIFLNWFSRIPCYEIIYSDNTKMIEAVTKLFADDL